MRSERSDEKRQAAVSRGEWHVQRDGAVLTLARRLPARFDVWAETRIPARGRLRLATQVRQDLWRALQGQRGFSPVIEIRQADGGLDVRAGGRIDGGRFDAPRVRQAIAAVLDDPDNRRRWLRCAGKVGQ
jgi:hypothetical protein